MMAHHRYEDTADQVDLLDRLDALALPKLRWLALAYAAPSKEPPPAVTYLDRTITLGRDPGAGGIELADPRTSRCHAKLELDEKRGVFSVRDQDSKNGTFVNGTRTSEVELSHGAVIRVGETIFVYSEVDLPEGLPRPRPDRSVSAARAVVEAQARLAAPTELSIMILGPTGAGKEVMARLIHESSGRSGKLVAVNCGSLNRELIASELFGHAAGAFSGASSDRAGLFLTADKGTLFLDEIADLPPDQQPSLLRAIQEKKVRPVGSDRELPIDVRIVTATHRPLPELVQNDHFRRDLYARLSGVVLNLPGLSERREEVLPFFSKLSGIGPERLTPDVAEALLLHDWPENVREVQHLAALLVLYTRERTFELSALPPHFGENLMQLRRRKMDSVPDLKTLDKEGLEALLVEHGGNVATVAKVLGKHRAQVYRLLRKTGLNPDDYRDEGEPTIV